MFSCLPCRYENLSFNILWTIRSVMHTERLLCIVLLVSLLVGGVSALEFRSGDRVVVDKPVNDDLFASGGQVSVDAPVKSVVVIGGLVDINGPVSGDVVAAGGQVTVNGNVGGKIVAAGGRVTVNGKADNLVAAGGQVAIGKGAMISRDAAVVGRQVVNEGDVAGTLYAETDGLINAGSVGTVVMPEKPSDEKGLPVLLVLVTLGFAILGCIIIRLFPRQGKVVADRVRSAPLLNFAYGIAGVLVTAVVTLIIAVTIIGLPVALLLGMGLIAVLVLAPVFTSWAFGDWLTSLMKKEWSMYLSFLLGFVVLHLLFAIPFLVGLLLRVIAVAIGAGAIFMVIWNYWKGSSSPSAAHP